jgi:hypothetical protein
LSAIVGANGLSLRSNEVENAKGGRMINYGVQSPVLRCLRTSAATRRYKMPTEIYSARMDESGTYSVYADGILVAERVARTNALLFEPEPQSVTLRLLAVGLVQAKVQFEKSPLRPTSVSS